MQTNYDTRTVVGFGEEWSRYDQTGLSHQELEKIFLTYFRIFPWEKLPRSAVGFDLGCGSGRWASLVAPRVGKLCCVDASSEALEVARKNLSGLDNCEFFNHSVDDLPFADQSFDFGYSLGVLHHVPDTQAGIKACVSKLKPGAPLLLYLYYAFDNRPVWFRMLWKVSDLIRRFISNLPFRFRNLLAQIIALIVYWPLARTAGVIEKTGSAVDNFPLSFYRDKSFYVMRTDALDRFGTRLEQRFTAEQIRRMMEASGLEKITFNDSTPFWCAVGYRKQS